MSYPARRNVGPFEPRGEMGGGGWFALRRAQLLGQSPQCRSAPPQRRGPTEQRPGTETPGRCNVREITAGGA